MAQIWLTYRELADFYRCPSNRIRQGVIENGWVRRKSHDGQTLVKLPNTLIPEFISRMAVRDESPSSLQFYGGVLPATAAALHAF